MTYAHFARNLTPGDIHPVFPIVTSEKYLPGLQAVLSRSLSNLLNSRSEPGLAHWMLLSNQEN
jgi:hypothetical protein